MLFVLCALFIRWYCRFIIVQLWFQNEFILKCMSKNVCNLKDCEIPKFCQQSLNVMNFKIKMFSFVFGFLCYQRNIWFRITANNNVCIFQGTKHKSGNLNLLENTVCLSSLNYNYYYYYVKLTDLKKSSIMLTLLWKHNNKDFL